MPCFLFHTADSTGAAMDKAGLLYPIRPGMTGSRYFNHKSGAATIAGGGLAAIAGTGGIGNRPLAQIVSRRGDGLCFRFTAGSTGIYLLTLL